MPGDEYIIFSAAVQDYTEEFFRRYERNITQMEQRTNQAMSSMDSGGRKSSAVMGLVAGAVGGVSAQLAGLAVKAMSTFPNIIKSATALTARVDTLGVSLRTVGGNAGYSAADLAKFEEAVKKNGITTRAARQTLLQMAQANLDLSKASEIARVAQDAAVIAGINSSEATMRLIYGITTLNPLILRNMGIIVNNEKEYAKWAATNNITTKSLDYATKQQIMLNAVLKAGTGIAGTYTSAMGSVGKQVTSLPRYVEELQLSLGRAFQPAYGEAVQWLTRELKDLRAWVEDNKDSIEGFAESFGKFTAIALEGLSQIIDLAAKVPGAIVDIGVAIADSIHKVEGHQDTLGVTFGKTVTILVSFIVLGLKMITESVSIAVDAVIVGYHKIKSALTLDWGGFVEAGDTEIERGVAKIENFGETMRTTFEDTFKSVADIFGLIDTVDTSNAEESVDRVRDATDKLADALADATAKLDALNAKYAEETAAEALKQQRQEIDDAINTARRYEDLQRNHQRRLDNIIYNATKSRQRLMEDLSKQEAAAADSAAKEREDLEREKNNKLLDIEIDYRRRLEDIQSDFQYQAAELARRNDAVGLLKLIRSKKRQLEEEEKSRERNREDAQINYERDKSELERYLAEKREQLRKDAQERLAELNENLRDQLASAEEARQQDLENLQRSLQRSQEDKERHRQWDAEDRARKHAQELEELGRHFASMEGLTEEGLARLLEEHASAITDLEALWSAYYAAQEQMARQAAEQAAESAGLGFIGGGRLPAAASGPWYNHPTFQTGGFGVVQGPQTITIGEKGPEAFAVLPMQSIVTHKFSDLNINLQGITPETEAQLLPVIYEAFVQLSHAVAGA